MLGGTLSAARRMCNVTPRQRTLPKPCLRQASGMDLPPAPAPRPEARQRIGWPFPWWGLASGAGFVALMATPLGVMPGFAMIWMIIIAAAPFMIVGGLIGGSTGGYVAGGLALATCVLGPVAAFVLTIVKAPDRPTRSRLLNKFVLFLLFLIGVAVAVRSLSQAWP
jgi:hypothetical protein